MRLISLVGEINLLWAVSNYVELYGAEQISGFAARNKLPKEATKLKKLLEKQKPKRDQRAAQIKVTIWIPAVDSEKIQGGLPNVQKAWDTLHL